MDKLWSASTTMRNPERAISFLKTIKELNGREWNKENQILFQVLLIKNRYYVPNEYNLTEKQKIIPLTIEHLVKILKLFKNCKTRNKKILSKDMKKFYDACCNIEDCSNSKEWLNRIKISIESLLNSVI